MAQFAAGEELRGWVFKKMVKRIVADCRQFPSEKNCSVTIAGTEEEVLPLAVHHAVADHGHQDTPKLREQIKGMFKEE